MPDTKLSVVGERIAQETSVIGRTGERNRLLLSHGINNGFYAVTETSRARTEVNAKEVIADGVELMTPLRESASCTELERTAIGREDRISLIDGVILEQGRKQ